MWPWPIENQETVSALSDSTDDVNKHLKPGDLAHKLGGNRFEEERRKDKRHAEWQRIV
jgi:hypothetical protein